MTRKAGGPTGPTDTDDDEEDDESVHHGDDGGRDGGRHLLERADATKEADDAKRPHELDKPGGNTGHAGVEEGNDHDEDVEVVPPVCDEGAHPVRKGVHSQLDAEVRSEEEVEAVHHHAERGCLAVSQHELAAILRLEYARHEVLRGGGGRSRV